MSDYCNSICLKQLFGLRKQIVYSRYLFFFFRSFSFSIFEVAEFKMEKYIICGKIGEGSFSEVLKGKFSSGDSAEFVAIKCIKHDEGAVVKRQSLPANFAVLESKEVFVLKLLKPHPNIIQLYDVFEDPLTSRICIVTELMDMNLYEYLQSYCGRPLAEPLVKRLLWQALSGLAHVHESGFFHRDLKPENILICKKTLTLKLADFGSCRETGSRPPYTEYIATRWYRAPECLLTMGHYSFEMDIWSLGCVMYELLTGRPLFPGKNETQQLQCIQKVLGKLLKKVVNNVAFNQDHRPSLYFIALPISSYRTVHFYQRHFHRWLDLSKQVRSSLY